MRSVLIVIAFGLTPLCSGCGDASDPQPQGLGAGPAAPTAPAPTTFKGISTGYRAEDPR